MKCKGCNKDFKKPIGSGVVYCTPECKAKKMAKEQLIRDKAKKKIKPEIKVCPRCETKHTNKGTFCCKSCAQVRVHTEADKEHRSKKRLEYYETPEGEAHKRKLSRHLDAMKKGETFKEVGWDDFFVDIPTIRDQSDYDDFFEDWEKCEDW